MSQLVSQKSTDHPGQQYVRQVVDHFEVKGPNGQHLCLAFEPLRQPLGMLYQQLGPNNPGRIRLLKSLMPSVLKCLDYLHTECQIVHTGE